MKNICLQKSLLNSQKNLLFLNDFLTGIAGFDLLKATYILEAKLCLYCHADFFLQSGSI